MSKILILDGYNLIYRARYSGMNKGNNSTIFNFFRGVRPLVERFNPDITYFVLEGRPTKRLEASPDYKGQRVYTDDDGFNRQRKHIISIIKEFIPFITVKHDDYECDDVINFLATNKHSNDETIIVSSDTDFIQSISENTQLYNPVKKDFISQKDFNYVHWKALVGDKSDNIQGFKGIGDKRAQKLLLDKDMLNDFLIKEDNQDKFNKNIFMIEFHDLTQDADDIKTFKPDTFNWDRLRHIFNEYDFKSLVLKDKTWNKYTSTFNKLQEGLQNVNWKSIR